MKRRSTRNRQEDPQVQRIRESINQIRRVSVSSIYGVESTNSEKRWRLSYLKNRFVGLDLNELFNRYTQRLGHGYFSLFLILQFILSLSHFLIVLITNMDSNTLDIVTPDLILYAVLTVLPVAGLFLSDNYMNRHPKILRYMTSIAFVLIVFVNFFVPVYHSLAHDNHETFRPAYTTHLLIAIYVFFNVHDNLVALSLGLTVSVFHVVVLTLVTYKNSSVMVERVLSDVIYLLCINGLGVYFRYMNEIVKRRSFLDRRECIESTLLLNYEKEQKNQLMLNILPEHIIEEKRKAFIDTIEHFEKTNDLPTDNPFEILVDEHKNVTILYADIVNYTEMTTKLHVTKLVETLNELFGRFDDASEELNVLRIKFLGDCYYCVAGLTKDYSANHAEACVDLGLKMIRIIRSVRERRDLAIDMRIGIHTGDVLSGTIGNKKCQFDVWSKDVDIANKMESTGSPGKIHITHKTKELLTKPYNIEVSNAGQLDQFLRENEIHTFLITPPIENKHSKLETKEPIKRLSDSSIVVNSNIKSNTNEYLNGSVKGDININHDEHLGRDSRYMRRPSGNPTLATIERRASGNPALTNATRLSNLNTARQSGSGFPRRERRSTPAFRRTAFMDNNIQKYNEWLRDIHLHLEKAIDNMPLSKYEQWFKDSKINPFLLLFKKLNTELQFLKMPDHLFKYYLLSEIVLIICVLIIQTLSVKQWEWWSWFSSGTAVLIALVLLPTTWAHFVWTKFVSNPYEEYKEEKHPKNVVIKFLYEIAEIITKNVVIRITIYLIICTLFVVCIFGELIECRENYKRNLNETFNNHTLRSFMRVMFSDVDKSSDIYCVIPWHMTETCALAIIVSFLFLRIYMWIKLLFAAGITIFYSYVILNFSDGYYKSNETYNYMMKSQIAHIICMVYLTFTLHLIDRQTDYMNRLDYLWNMELIEEQKKANLMHKFNTIMLNTILPEHVAKYYLNVNRELNELYHENYNSVAVMFASIIADISESTDKLFLTNMNDIIKGFDQLLSTPNGKPIEKIKVAKWTYMAACGLDPGGQGGEMEENGDKSSNGDVVVQLLKFAVDMINTLNALNRESGKDFKLRIGIAHGELTAGVVGSKKPLYDIWGDPVNMASRMDSTGIAGKIQVPEKTAKVIMRQSYKCEFRGEIQVKGIQGNVPTYFVSLDEKNKLINGVQTLL